MIENRISRLRYIKLFESFVTDMKMRVKIIRSYEIYECWNTFRSRLVSRFERKYFQYRFDVLDIALVEKRLRGRKCTDVVFNPIKKMHTSGRIFPFLVEERIFPRF